VARLETGALLAERVRLAAYLGDPGALIALQSLAPDGEELFAPPWAPHCRTHAELLAWLAGLPGCDAAWLQRAAWVAGRAWLLLFRSAVGSWESAIDALLPALELAVGAPEDEERRRSVAQAGAAFLRWRGRDADADPARQCLAHLVHLFGGRHQVRALQLEVIASADRPPPEASRRACVRASVSEGRVRNLLRAELVPLLLA